MAQAASTLERLDRDTEVSLIELVQSKHTKKTARDRANNRLYNNYLPWLQSEAGKAARSTKIEYDDAFQTVSYAFSQAIQRFDPKKATRLHTYTTWWIRAYVTETLQNNQRMHLPKAISAQLHKLNIIHERHAATNPERLDYSTLYAEFKKASGMSDKATKTALEYITARPVYIGTTIYQHEGYSSTRAYGIDIADKTDTEAEVILKDQYQHALTCMDELILLGKLKPIHKSVMLIRSSDKTTLREVGEIHNQSTERARQLEADAIVKLRAYVEENTNHTVLDHYKKRLQEKSYSEIQLALLAAITGSVKKNISQIAERFNVSEATVRKTKQDLHLDFVQVLTKRKLN